MTRVDFYVLADASSTTRLDFVCTLAEKACGQTNKVFVYSSERGLLQDMDARLWDFRALSFVAHRLLPDAYLAGTQDNDPVLLSSDGPGNDRNVLINLDSAVPPFFSRFGRALEVVNKEPDIQQAGRERYRFYKNRGYPLQHHNV